MNTSYIVLGGVLVLMGSVQIWLRYGSWGKEQQEAELALAKRRAAANEADADDADDADADASTGTGSRESGPVFADRGSKLWNKWTAILGPLGIALGLFLVLWGIFKV